MVCAAELPKDLMLHIFSAQDDAWEERINHSILIRDPTLCRPILTPKDRARCQVVCRNWRAWLSPGALPLEMAIVSARDLGVHGDCCGDDTREWHLTRQGMHHHPAAAQWLGSSRAAVKRLALDICLGDEADQAGAASLNALLDALLQLEPGALKVLNLLLGSTSAPLQLFWPILPRFTALQWLNICAGFDGSLSHSQLAGLPWLEELEVSLADEVVLEGSGPLLPHLTRLECTDAGRLEVAAELPSLHELVTSRVEDVVLASAALRLPALTKLETASCCLRVDWESMPSLQHLVPPVMGLIELVGDPARFATLTQLTSLELRWVPDVMAPTYTELLQHAPRTLCSLRLGVATREETERFVPAALLAALAAGAPQLTHLACFGGADDNADSAGLVLPHLAPFKQLEELRLEWEAVGSLTLSQLGVLEGLPNLKKLLLNERYIVQGTETPEAILTRMQQLEMLSRALGDRVQVQDRATNLHMVTTTEVEQLVAEYLTV